MRASGEAAGTRGGGDLPRKSLTLAGRMLIKTHQKAYSVELEDGSTWRIWPPDMSGTLQWSASTNLNVLEIDDNFSTHALVDQDGRRVRVVSSDANWIPKRMRAYPSAAE